MSRFVQLHLLTSYPPSNLNRDDLGRPKTAMMGGFNRLRVSSQSLKRAWRKSDAFESALKGHIGTRTKEMGEKVYKQLIDKGVKEKKAQEWAKAIANAFGAAKTLSKKEKENLKKLPKEEREKKEMTELHIEQLAHFSPEEETAIGSLVESLAASDKGPTADELKLLREKHTAADIALFGRMLASSPGNNTEAAAQVAHAITVHKVAVEDDYFTAVDDLNDGKDDMGAGHIGETEFGAGLFYLYICIDRDLLKENLSGDEELMKKTLAAVTEAAAIIAPTGKQKSFASNARASYILCEKGNQQPRSLSVAFLKAANAKDMFEDSVSRLEDTRDKMDSAYGKCWDEECVMNVHTGKGSLKEIIDCATS